jgi:hypothetical protein
MSTGWASCWADALAQIELDADRAEELIRRERLIDAEQPVWEPPTGLGPLPEDLIERAHRILDRHTEIAAELAHLARENRLHASLLSRIETGASNRVPVYVDQNF